MNRLMLSVAALGLLSGCASTNLTTFGSPREARDENCDFKILTTIPEGHEEIGTVDVKRGLYGAKAFRSLSRFQNHIRPWVCEAGGEAAVAQADGYGYYVRATVLVAAAESKPASSASESEAGGCQYDTQCKGDRVCKDGECVSP